MKAPTPTTNRTSYLKHIACRTHDFSYGVELKAESNKATWVVYDKRTGKVSNTLPMTDTDHLYYNQAKQGLVRGYDRHFFETLADTINRGTIKALLKTYDKGKSFEWVFFKDVNYKGKQLTVRETLCSVGQA